MDALDAELAQVGAILVEDRVLRRIIKRDRRLPGIGLQVPHAQCYAIARAALFELAEARELGLGVDASALPDRVTVFRGGRTDLAAGKPDAHSHAWRSIFHARVHQAFDERLAANALTAAVIRERVNRIGQTEFDEIRFVLRQEDLLLPPADDTATYIEFAALYLELKHFAPRALARTFPALHDTGDVEATIALDIDGDALLVASRPPRAPATPILETGVAITGVEPAVPVAIVAKLRDPSAIPAAATARRKGNRARAAMLSFRGGEPIVARGDLDALVERLATALGGPPTAGWTDALAPVAQFAAGQRVLRFTAGARLLHDLQSACVVAEHEVKVVDTVTWALSLGKRPIVRALPMSRAVRVAKHLHAAADKISEVGLASAEDRELLATAVHEMVERADLNVRTELRPKIEEALDAVDLKPRHLPERVAQKKVVDELLDQAVEVGRLSIGNLRDALSHNDLKMPDLRASELVSGDQLLRADHLLSISLDGVYRRGEIYLRFLQKLSSILFGTSVGRFLSLYLMLPLIGSFVALEGTQHVVVGLLLKHLVGIDPQIVNTESFIGVAVFLFLLIHAPPFRRGVAFGLRILWRALRTVLFTAPLALWRLRGVRAVFGSTFGRWVLKPAIPAAIAWFLARGRDEWPIAAVVFVFVELLTNSETGRLAEEIITDGMVRSGRQVARRIVPGLVKYLLDLFVELIELLDRAIYRVDEMLRFRVGQSTLMLVIKGTLGTLWFVIAYFLRFYVNLFVEPVINPIKHFPTVTVAAKLTLPFASAMTDAIKEPLRQVVGGTLAGSFAWFTVFVIPGLAGFMVWELKENWKLYRKTRPDTLREVSIGHHGESMVAFMKPGFHSGTIPKLYAKLRRATWHGDERGVAKHREGLHHVEEAIEKFAGRELASLLNEAAPFRATDVAVAHVEMGSNRVQIAISCPSVAPHAAMIAFEQQSGWLVASLPQAGWLDALDDTRRNIFEIALAGFYKLAGVDLVREQLEALLRDRDNAAPPYDISEEGLVVWPGQGYETEGIYDLHARELAPAMRGAPIDRRLPSLTGVHALYVREPLRWSVWTRTWDEIVAGTPPPKLVLGPSLLRAKSPS